MEYDVLGRLESVDDVERGGPSTTPHDAVGNRISMDVTPAELAEEPTTYAWDARGLLTRMTDPEGGEDRFACDDVGRRTSSRYPNSMTLTTVYDAASRVLAMVYRNGAGA